MNEKSVDDNLEVPVKKKKIDGSTSNINNNQSLNEDACRMLSGEPPDNSAQQSYSIDGHEKNSPISIQHEGDASPLSTASESDWQPSTHGAFEWIHNHMQSGIDPREILTRLVPGVVAVPTDLNDWAIWRLLLRLISEPPRRKKLPSVNTFDDAIELIKSSKKIIILTGAGVSVSCGIPDFRSRDGVYARLAVDFPNLPSPEAMFDISYFRQDPRPFFKFAKEIFPGQYMPSRIHRFIAMLEKSGQLLRNYTQNIDTLEQVAGIKRVVQCHGSFATATCQACKYQTDCDSIREDIFNQVIPRCPRCGSEDGAPGILKPDIVFFGESLPEHFHRQMTTDKDEADLLIVIGSTLKVRPVALIPNSLPPNIPQILINREALSHQSFDVELLGDGDVIVSEICRRLEGDFMELVTETDGLLEVRALPGEAGTDPENAASISTPASDACPDASISDSTSAVSAETVANLVLPETDGRGSASASDSRTFPSHGDQRRPASSSAAASSETAECSSPSDTSASASHSQNTAATSDHRGNAAAGKAFTTDSRTDAARNPAPETCPGRSLPGAAASASQSGMTSDTTSDLPCPGNYLAATCSVSEPVSSTSSDMDDMKGLWRSRWKQSISKRLPPNSYYFDGGHRYIFPGAEVAPEEETESSDDDDEDDDDDDCRETSPPEPLPPVNELPSSCHSAQTSSCSIGSDDGKADEAEAFDTSSCGLSKTDMLPND